KRGRKMGYPTANLVIEKKVLLSKPGILAVKVIHKGEKYEGMSCLRTNPTFTEDKKDLSLEVNILDYNNNLYGEELELEWHKYIREEIKFRNTEDLVEQIKKDEIEIRNFFK